MSKTAFENNIMELIRAIEICIKNKYEMPSLILIYSGIDILGFLNRPIREDDMHLVGQDFRSWTKKYLLPILNFLSDEYDLYSSRNAILHTYTFESNMVRERRALRIYYTWGIQKAEEPQEAILKRNGKSDKVWINVNDLFFAFKKAINKFKKHLSTDSKKANLVYKRTEKYFVKY